MIIGACGFGSTGSSVITDYLKEYDDIQVKDDFEMTWVSGTDGLIDLERAVMNPHCRTADSILAINRYLERAQRCANEYYEHGMDKKEFLDSSRKLIDSITTTKWYWKDNRDSFTYKSKYFFRAFVLYKIIPKIEQKKGKHVQGWPLKEVRLSVRPENFYADAKLHVEEILKGVGLDTNGIIAMDQPFAGNNPQACFPFFDDPYAVVVDRDPRDNYVFARTRMLGRFHFMPINDVESFIAYYKALRKHQPYLNDDKRILRIKFEEMVYEYEETTNKVRKFLNLPTNPRPKSVFDPELSKANTQVFKRFPHFSDDIKKIEQELAEYLYDFSRFPEPDFSKKMFYGKSPLHEAFNKSFSEK